MAQNWLATGHRNHRPDATESKQTQVSPSMAPTTIVILSPGQWHLLAVGMYLVVKSATLTYGLWQRSRRVWIWRRSWQRGATEAPRCRCCHTEHRDDRYGNTRSSGEPGGLISMETRRHTRVVLAACNV